MATTAQPANLVPITFVAMSARRVLVFGGTALITGGMLFGDIFAVFCVAPERRTNRRSSSGRFPGGSSG
jgi:hypothetical protein